MSGFGGSISNTSDCLMPCWLKLKIQPVSVFQRYPVLNWRQLILSDVHRDPFDRIIIATALELDTRLASLDGYFASYPELAGRLITNA
jgi:PIN domain nuclease of toxin-antitoxin system